MRNNLLLPFKTLLVLLSLFYVGCKDESSWEPILISKDACHYCKMVVTDKRFGAEFVTQKGKVYKFDAIECMGHHLEEHRDLKGKAYVVDSFNNSKLIPFKAAKFFHDTDVRSPMGKGIFASEDSQVLLRSGAGVDKIVDYQEILKLIGRPEIDGQL